MSKYSKNLEAIKGSGLIEKRRMERQQRILDKKTTAGLEPKKEVTNSLSEPQMKDLKPDVIDTKQPMKVSSADDLSARLQGRPSQRPGSVLNYPELKEEFRKKQLEIDSEDRLARRKAIGQLKAGGKKLMGLMPLAGAASAIYSGESPAAAIAEDLMPDILQPTESGPAKGTPERELETGMIPQGLQYSPEEELMIRQRRGYEDGGVTQNLNIRKQLLKKIIEGR
jgi:hypothetical protein